MNEFTLRNCVPSDVEAVVRFVAECPPLDLHSSFTYWVTFEYWGEMCFVLTQEEQIVGYASAIGSGHDKGVFYLWQVGIKSDLRSAGLAQRLIRAVVDAALSKGLREMQVSIAPENESSLRAFERFAGSLDRSLERCGEVSFYDPEGKSVRERLFSLAITG